MASPASVVPSAPRVSFRAPHAKWVLKALLNCFLFCVIIAFVSLSLFPSTFHFMVELVGSSLVFVGMRSSLIPGPLPLPMGCWHFRYMRRFSSWRCNCKRVLVFLARRFVDSGVDCHYEAFKVEAYVFYTVVADAF
jgi:hypothetical protein